MKSLKIGPLILKNRLFLAPMVDVTDLPYRLLCREAGAGMAYTEMLNIGSILHANTENRKFSVLSTSKNSSPLAVQRKVAGNSKTKNIMKTNKLDSPCGIQITGKSVKEFEDVSDREELHKFGLVDINCGCPSSRIVDNQSGSYLLKTPEKIGEMIRVLKDKGFTVTAKIRLGFRNNNVIEVSRKLEKAGADLLTIHARLANQKNSVPADWSWIGKVKREVGIPVVGNGGITSGPSAVKMLDICDGAMIAGAAIGNPSVFKEILYYLRTGKERKVNSKESVKAFLEYLSLAEKYDVVEMPRIKFLGGWFLRGFGGAAKKRAEFMGLKNVEEVVDFLGKI